MIRDIYEEMVKHGFSLPDLMEKDALSIGRISTAIKNVARKTDDAFYGGAGSRGGSQKAMDEVEDMGRRYSDTAGSTAEVPLATQKDYRNRAKIRMDVSRARKLRDMALKTSW